MANVGTQQISIIVPSFNEEANITQFFAALTRVLKKIEHEFEIIFVNDGSSDNTQREINKLCDRHSHVSCVELVRNFGKEIALSAGLEAANGHAAIMIDADLQHPVELIPDFIKHWLDGHEHVVGIRTHNKGISPFKRWTSRIFYRTINRISHTSLSPGMTDFQLVDRVIIDEFKRFTERGRVTRGLLSWLGFPMKKVEFKANERTAGVATYNTFKLIQLATNSFVSLSLFPLRIAGYTGLFITFFSGLLGIYMYFDRYIFNDPFDFNFTGTAFLAMLLIFLVGIVLSCLGLVALYIGSIHNEVLNRPLYVARKRK